MLARSNLDISTLEKFKPPWIEESPIGQIHVAWKWPKRRIFERQVHGFQTAWRLELQSWTRQAAGISGWTCLYRGQEVSLTVQESPEPTALQYFRLMLTVTYQKSEFGFDNDSQEMSFASPVIIHLSRCSSVALIGLGRNVVVNCLPPVGWFGSTVHSRKDFEPPGSVLDSKLLYVVEVLEMIGGMEPRAGVEGKQLDPSESVVINVPGLKTNTQYFIRARIRHSFGQSRPGPWISWSTLLKPPEMVAATPSFHLLALPSAVASSLPTAPVKLYEQAQELKQQANSAVRCRLEGQDFNGNWHICVSTNTSSQAMFGSQTSELGQSQGLRRPESLSKMSIYNSSPALFLDWDGPKGTQVEATSSGPATNVAITGLPTASLCRFRCRAMLDVRALMVLPQEANKKHAGVEVPYYWDCSEPVTFLTVVPAPTFEGSNQDHPALMLKWQTPTHTVEALSPPPYKFRLEVWDTEAPTTGPGSRTTNTDRRHVFASGFISQPSFWRKIFEGPENEINVVTISAAPAATIWQQQQQQQQQVNHISPRPPSRQAKDQERGTLSKPCSANFRPCVGVWQLYRVLMSFDGNKWMASERVAAIMAPPAPSVDYKTPPTSSSDLGTAEAEWNCELDISCLPEGLLLPTLELELQLGWQDLNSSPHRLFQESSNQNTSESVAGQMVIASKSVTSLAGEPFRELLTCTTPEGSLRRGRRYAFRGVIRTAYGVAISKNSTFETATTVPLAPPLLMADSQKFVSAAGKKIPYLHLSWQRPAQNGCAVQSYQLQVRRAKKSSGGAKSKNEINWTSEWKQIYEGPETGAPDNDSLNRISKTTALYRVRAKNSLGWSPWSETLMVLDGTIADAELAPEKIKDSALSSNQKDGNNCFPLPERNKRHSSSCTSALDTSNSSSKDACGLNTQQVDAAFKPKESKEFDSMLEYEDGFRDSAKGLESLKDAVTIRWNPLEANMETGSIVAKAQDSQNHFNLESSHSSQWHSQAEGLEEKSRESALIYQIQNDLKFPVNKNTIQMLIHKNKKSGENIDNSHTSDEGCRPNTADNVFKKKAVCFEKLPVLDPSSFIFAYSNPLPKPSSAPATDCPTYMERRNKSRKAWTEKPPLSTQERGNRKVNLRSVEKKNDKTFSAVSVLRKSALTSMSVVDWELKLRSKDATFKNDDLLPQHVSYR